ncbi:hypothetical protein BGW80DRAFT_1294030 [Lactifluus volemus]|nr:hypothetical protein BGW80DRAFT_1294030 [Lactifluus volemus]
MSRTRPSPPDPQNPHAQALGYEVWRSHHGRRIWCPVSRSAGPRGARPFLPNSTSGKVRA